MKMNNKNIGIIAVVTIGIVVILGGGLFMINQNSQKQASKMEMEKSAMMQKEEEAMPKDDQIMKDENKVMANESSSRYIEYTSSALEDTIKNKRLLFFYANWCPICRPVDTALKNNSNLIPDGVSVIRVNFNDPDTDQEEKDLAKKYGVTYQHTFVQIDEKGNLLNKWSGGEIKEILSNLK